MPAGNDSAAAQAELADQFALGQARAEDLRSANRARYPNELRTAQLKERNDEATEALDWSKAASACDVDVEDVLDAAVRGDQVVVVFEDDRGDTQKACCYAEDAGVEVQTVGSRAQRRRREAAEAAIEKAAEAAEKEEKKKPSSKKGGKRSGRSRSKKKG